MADPRYVLDTNVLVSALLFEYSIPWQALHRATERGRLLMSGDAQVELQEVLLREKFDRYVSIEKRLNVLNDVLDIAEMPIIEQRIAACRDPRDDKFLEVAVNGGASCIVTGDDDLLALNPFRGIDILTPRDFLEQMSRSGVDEEMEPR